MNVAIQFYRWLTAKHLLSPSGPMWREWPITITLPDSGWFERTITLMTTDLAIPNRKRNSAGLEDGLLPVSPEERATILSLVDEHCSVELLLMLQLGFNTGMRLGSISDLKVGTILNAVPDPSGEGAYLLSIGPHAQPPVHTKWRTYGHVMVPAQLFADLVKYSKSPRRLARRALTSPANSDLLFLTRFGNRYADPKSDKSGAVNVEMHKLRSVARAYGHNLNHFHFHMSRTTFACDAARVAIKYQKDGIDPVEVVGDMLFQSSRAVTEAYIKYVKNQPIRAEIANEFTRTFLGILERKTKPPDA